MPSEVKEILSQWHIVTSRKYCIFCSAGVRAAYLTVILLLTFQDVACDLQVMRTDVLLCNYNVFWNKSDASTTVHPQQTLRKKHI